MANVEALQKLTLDQTGGIPDTTGLVEPVEPRYRNKETARIHQPGVKGLYGDWPDSDYTLGIRQADR